jgi:hypothetical protein
MDIRNFFTKMCRVPNHEAGFAPVQKLSSKTLNDFLWEKKVSAEKMI